LARARIALDTSTKHMKGFRRQSTAHVDGRATNRLTQRNQGVQCNVDTLLLDKAAAYFENDAECRWQNLTGSLGLGEMPVCREETFGDRFAKEDALVQRLVEAKTKLVQDECTARLDTVRSQNIVLKMQLAVAGSRLEQKSQLLAAAIASQGREPELDTQSTKQAAHTSCSSGNGNDVTLASLAEQMRATQEETDTQMEELRADNERLSERLETNCLLILKKDQLLAKLIQRRTPEDGALNDTLLECDISKEDLTDVARLCGAEDILGVIAEASPESEDGEENDLPFVSTSGSLASTHHESSLGIIVEGSSAVGGNMDESSGKSRQVVGRTWPRCDFQSTEFRPTAALSCANFQCAGEFSFPRARDFVSVSAQVVHPSPLVTEPASVSSPAFERCDKANLSHIRAELANMCKIAKHKYGGWTHAENVELSLLAQLEELLSRDVFFQPRESTELKSIIGVAVEQKLAKTQCYADGIPQVGQVAVPVPPFLPSPLPSSSPCLARRRRSRLVAAGQGEAQQQEPAGMDAAPREAARQRPSSSVSLPVSPNCMRRRNSTTVLLRNPQEGSSISEGTSSPHMQKADSGCDSGSSTASSYDVDEAEVSWTLQGKAGCGTPRDECEDLQPDMGWTAPKRPLGQLRPEGPQLASPMPGQPHRRLSSPAVLKSDQHLPLPLICSDALRPSSSRERRSVGVCVDGLPQHPLTSPAWLARISLNSARSLSRRAAKVKVATNAFDERRGLPQAELQSQISIQGVRCHGG